MVFSIMVKVNYQMLQLLLIGLKEKIWIIVNVGYQDFLLELFCFIILMRRPEVNNFIAISPQPNVYDFSFLAPCPTSGQVVYSDNDELVTKESINELDNRIKNQKGVEVIFSKIKGANHFFKDKEKELRAEIEKYIEDKTALI